MEVALHEDWRVSNEEGRNVAQHGPACQRQRVLHMDWQVSDREGKYIDRHGLASQR